MSRAPSTTIEGGTAGTALGALWVGFFAVLALVAILLAVSSGFNPVVRVVCLAVAAGLAFLGWRSFRRMFAAEGRLRINVADDAIEFQLQGHLSEVLTRAEIGLITINEGRLQRCGIALGLRARRVVARQLGDEVDRQAAPAGQAGARAPWIPRRADQRHVRQPALLLPPRACARWRPVSRSAPAPELDSAAISMLLPDPSPKRPRGSPCAHPPEMISGLRRGSPAGQSAGSQNT